MTVLSGAEWRAAATAHRERAAAELADVIHRRDRAVKHPIDDFLFHYYNLRPSYLMAWYPGAGVTLADAVDFPLGAFHRRDGDEVRLDVETFLAKRGATAETALTLLEAMLGIAAPRPIASPVWVRPSRRSGAVSTCSGRGLWQISRRSGMRRQRCSGGRRTRPLSNCSRRTRALRARRAVTRASLSE